MQEKIKNKVKKRFKNIDFKKIVLYKNPNEFCHVFIERVNPNHVGILWGRRKKSLNKGSHYIKWGKVYFSMLPIIMGLTTSAYIDAITSYAYNILVNIGLSGLIVVLGLYTLMCYAPFRFGCDIKCSIC